MADFLLNNSVFLIGGSVLLMFFVDAYIKFFRTRKTTDMQDFNLIKLYSVLEARKHGKRYHPDLHCAWSKETIKD